MSDERIVRVEAGAPTRLESFVRAELPRLSRRVARLLIAGGAVRVNGHRAGKGASLTTGDLVALPVVSTLAPEPEMALEVLHADPRVVAVAKPGGVPGHALDPRERGTIAGAALARYPELATIGDALAPGLAHRLDTGTSGVLLLARTRESYAELRACFRRHDVHKRYLAVVAGAPTPGQSIDVPLAHDPRDRGRMIPARPGDRAWPARTDVVEVRPHGAFTLAVVEIRTGVTHQVRAHLALAGCPVVGDTRYGGPPCDLAPERHGLHAARIGVPAWDLEVEAPFPDDLARLALAPGG